MDNPNYTFLKSAISERLRIALLQGGTRSGKTFATLQFIISVCMKYKNAGIVISICRRTMPALKATAMRDFIQLLSDAGLYAENNHNKTEANYLLNGNVVEFVNLDDEQKVRGRKRHMLYVNEANENTHEVIRQLLFRTSGLCIFDYNPSINEDHWLITDMLNRPNAKRLISTYKDNPYLSQAQVAEIERLQSIDEELWKVFGLGEIGQGMRGLVFKNWQYGWQDGGRVAFGLDFGYSPDPLALVECRIIDNVLYAKQHIYRNNMPASEIVRAVSACVPKGVPVYCDHRQDIIDDLWRAGVNVHSAQKGAGSIDYGIKLMQGYNLSIHEGSHDLIKEVKYYKYREDKDGNPIGGAYADTLNHAIDAWRYAVVGLLGVQKVVRGVAPVEAPLFMPG